MLEENLQPPDTEEDWVTAATVPLPDSIAASASGQSSNGAQEASITDYAEEIHQLQEYMPHLKNVGQRSRAHNKAVLDCLDYSGSELISTTTHSFESDLLRSKDDFAAIMDNVSPHVHVRLLLVNDLSSKLIDILGSYLHINPEFFEEHILNAGWCDNSYGGTNSGLWNTTASPGKDYTTIRWHRPVHSISVHPNAAKDALIFDPSTIPDSWEENPSPATHIFHSTKPVVNQLRLPWQAIINDYGFSAWEETATVWTTETEHCQLILVLLDPLPLIRYRVRVVESNRQIGQTRRPGQAHRGRDTFEGDRGHDPEDGGRPSPFNLSILGDITDWCSKLFKLRAPRNGGIEAAPTLASRIEAESHEPTPDPNQRRVQPIDRDEVQCMFTDSGPRLAIMDRNRIMVPEYRSRLARNTGRQQSTIEALKQPQVTQVASRSTELAALDHLCLIVIFDTLRMLRLIDTALTKIDLGMLDDALVQVHIDDWRGVLHRFEVELRSMETSIPGFVDFTLVSRKQKHGTDSAARKSTMSFEGLLDRFQREVAVAQKRTKITYRSLMTTMSLIESKRGISEAESVTKLTELAFFFIPLTFAASLFSMQVKELDASRTSVALFLAVAITITICSYTLRLVIRSSSFLGFWRLWKEKIRADSQIRPSASIPTSAVLKWLWKRVHTHILPLVFLVLTAALLSGVWTHPLQEGIQIAVTMTLALLTLTAILLLIVGRYDIVQKLRERKKKAVL